jgi:organic hydroperoxide reductase OsmC/OhrA
VSEYVTYLEWKGGQQIALSADQKPGLTVTPPKEFGGTGQEWSPEELMGGAVDSCLLLTTLYFVRTLKIELTSYRSSATVQMDRTADGLRFQEITLKIDAAVSKDEDVGKMKSAIEQAEAHCPVSAVVKCPVNVVLETRVEK